MPSLPPLTGSPAQVKWAGQIRTVKLQAIAQCVEKLARRADARGDDQLAQLLRRDVLRALQRITEASQWIAYRNYDVQEMVEATLFKIGSRDQK